MDENRLERFLREQRSELQAALEEAEAEINALDTRRAELRTLITNIRAALASQAPNDPAAEAEPEEHLEDGELTLHGAMALVLEMNPDGLSPRDLTDEINRANLYRKRDGSPVEINQIHARANNYSHLFQKEGGRIRLK